jgi:hypothetical protein
VNEEWREGRERRRRKRRRRRGGETFIAVVSFFASGLDGRFLLKFFASWNCGGAVFTVVLS